jgi:hypothetical protein
MLGLFFLVLYGSLAADEVHDDQDDREYQKQVN